MRKLDAGEKNCLARQTEQTFLAKNASIDSILSFHLISVENLRLSRSNGFSLISHANANHKLVLLRLMEFRFGGVKISKLFLAPVKNRYFSRSASSSILSNLSNFSLRKGQIVLASASITDRYSNYMKNGRSTQLSSRDWIKCKILSLQLMIKTNIPNSVKRLQTLYGYSPSFTILSEAW